MTTLERPLEPPAQPVPAVPRTSVGATEPLVLRARDERVRIYVWQIPVRVTHWVTVGSIMVLSATGLYIADPFVALPGGGVMTTARFIHMVSAFVLVASLILRTYWWFAGNRFARWSAFIPTNRRHARELAQQTGWYLFIRKEVPRVLGHNALAAGTYMAVFSLLVIMAVTGFALAGIGGKEPYVSLFGWVFNIFDAQFVRMIHHGVMWVLLAFMVHHVYSALLVDHWERNGLMASIFSGYKFVTRHEIDEARDGGTAIQEEAE
jgi:Ni/Fe-hydrogenase 1 B-type cytochrome subunit